MISLADLSRDIDSLDPPPETQTRLAAMVADTRVGLRQIVAVLEYDPALTAGALRLANSAFYASPSPILTVRDAVQRLGVGRILQDLVGRRLKGRLDQPYPGYDLEEHELWQHSIAAAVAADLLPRYARVPIPPMAFTAALLHDIGKMVISRHLDSEIKSEIHRIAESRQLPYVEAERVVLGFDHAQVGGVVARRWKFPDDLADAISHHHQPRSDGADNRGYDAVHVANAVAKTIGLGLGTEQMNMLADISSPRALGITPGTLEALCAATVEALPAVLALFEDAEHGV